KLIFATLWRVSLRWRGVRFSEHEQRQLAKVRERMRASLGDQPGDDPPTFQCQGRNEMPQNRRSKVPQKRRFEKSPASVVLLHRGRRGKMTEHAGFQFLLQAIALAANVDGDGMMQQAVQDGRRDHMVVKNVT